MPRKASPSSETRDCVFAAKLREMMQIRGVTQSKLADSITDNHDPIRRQTISNYMNGQSEPNTTVLTHIAEALDVSADYLLGLSDVKATESNAKIACGYLGISEDAALAIKDYVRSNGDAFDRIMRSPILHAVLRDMQALLSSRDLDRPWNEAMLVYSDLVALVNDIVTNNR